jgi:hypothetical protein
MVSRLDTSERRRKEVIFAWLSLIVNTHHRYLKQRDLRDFKTNGHSKSTYPSKSVISLVQCLLPQISSESHHHPSSAFPFFRVVSLLSVPFFATSIIFCNVNLLFFPFHQFIDHFSVFDTNLLLKNITQSLNIT